MIYLASVHVWKKEKQKDGGGALNEEPRFMQTFIFIQLHIQMSAQTVIHVMEQTCVTYRPRSPCPLLGWCSLLKDAVLLSSS